MTSGWQGAPRFRRYGRELVSEPATSLKKVWGGYRRMAQKCKQKMWLIFPTISGQGSDFGLRSAPSSSENILSQKTARPFRYIVASVLPPPSVCATAFSFFKRNRRLKKQLISGPVFPGLHGDALAIRPRPTDLILRWFCAQTRKKKIHVCGVFFYYYLFCVASAVLVSSKQP